MNNPTNRAKELADDIRNHGYSGNPTHAQEVATLLSCLAAIDSAVPGEVGEIAARCAAGRAGDNILQAVHDIKALLAIVQRQEYEALESCGAHEAKDLALSRSQADLARLTERLRTMQHGETEALKMLGAEKRRADELADQLERTKLELAAALAMEAQAEKDGDEARLQVDILKAEAAQLRKIISDSVNALGNHSVASPDCTLDFMSRVPDEIRHAVKKLRDLAETLAKGISAYRWKSESVAAAWENDYGQTVSR